jgi:catechol 2,3-dioxygenase-like lactoylglutathione lyase family enzyme
MTAVEVGIVTTDARRLAAFYQAGLGFSLESVFDFPRGSVYRLRRDAARCKLFQPAADVRDKPPAETFFAFRGIGYGALLVDDADAEVARARAEGATVLEGPIAHRPGARYALIEDPDGNVWEILEER